MASTDLHFCDQTLSIKKEVGCLSKERHIVVDRSFPLGFKTRLGSALGFLRGHLTEERTEREREREPEREREHKDREIEK